MKRLATVFSILLAPCFALPACGDQVTQAGFDTDSNVNSEALDEVGIGDNPGETDASRDPADRSTHTPDGNMGDARAGAENHADSVENVAGRHDHLITLEGQDREFIVYVPALAEGPVEAPVVFMFHGTTGDGERFYNISGWREAADAHGLIAVFPSALTYCFYDDENGDGDYDDPGERKVTTKWAAGKLGDEFPLCTADDLAGLSPSRRARADHPLVDDVAFFDAMLEVLETDYAINSRQVYASGFSNGGAMSSYLAAHRSDRIAAAAAAAGFLHPDVTTPTARPISMVLSLGELDDGLTSALGIEAVPLDESFVELAGARGLIDRYLTVLQLTPDYTFDTRLVNGRTVSRFTFSTSSAGADNELQVAVIEGLHHQYPNGRNHPIAIAEPLWTFFSRYTLD